MPKSTAYLNISGIFGQMNEIIKSIFANQHGYATSGDITKSGIHKSVIKKLEEAQLIHKVRRGLYRWNELADGSEAMIEVCKLVPSGILCLLSAWHYYDLSTYIPHEHHVAINKNEKVRLPDYPPIKLYFRDKTNYELGITDRDGIRIYDLEKSICDLIKYREKIGMDTVSEVLKNYLHRTDKNLDQLFKYAKVMRIELILKEYLLILL